MNDIGNRSASEQDYGAWYYANYSGKPYDTGDRRWRDFFDLVADRLVQLLAPATALDAGCAMGILVGSLRARGVDAEGIDLSPYAIEHGDPRADGRLRTGPLEQPLGRRYDVICCIEVLEHVDAGQVEQVIGNLCSATDVVLLSSTPDDFNEGTHVNVRPPSYWLALFADHGFHRRFDVDASFVSPQAVLLQRQPLAPRQLIAEYETRLWDLMRENRGTRVALMNRDRELATAVDVGALRGDLARARERADAAEALLCQARSEADAAHRRLRAVQQSQEYRFGSTLVGAVEAVRRAVAR